MFAQTFKVSIYDSNSNNKVLATSDFGGDCYSYFRPNFHLACIKMINFVTNNGREGAIFSAKESRLLKTGLAIKAVLHGGIRRAIVNPLSGRWGCCL